MQLIRIGRSDSNEMQLADPTVSRRHAEIVILDDGGVFVTDCASTSGTFFEEAGQWQPIRQGFVDADARLKLGDTVMTVRELITYR